MKKHFNTYLDAWKHCIAKGISPLLIQKISEYNYNVRL